MPSAVTLPRQVKNILDERFERLVVISFAGTRKTSNGSEATWRCRCDCGAEIVVSGASLRVGNTRSCGCLAREMTAQRNLRHGYAARNKKGPEYTAWINMKTRCYKKDSEKYHLYGGRGIRVCSRWLHGEGGLTGFQCFRIDMGPRPSPKHSVDRRDTNGDYEPDNCRWATQATQVRNSSKATMITYRGESMSIIDAAERFGIAYGCLRSRLRYGWPVERAIEAPSLKVRS